MSRTYPWPVPYTTGFKDGAAIVMGLGIPAVRAALPRLPAALVAKLNAVGPWHHVTFTKAELDSVPDDLWKQLEPHLG